MKVKSKIVAGNWKMNKTLPEALELMNDLIQRTAIDKSIEKIIFPPFPLLSPLNDCIAQSERNDFYIGAQNCHHEKSGAFTGEISAQLLASINCRYVIVGHSERRQYFNESNSLLRQKLIAALNSKLIPILCLGETLDFRKDGKHFELVNSQLVETIGDLADLNFSDMIIAYEPVWAIGTGETASPSQAQEMHSYIRKILASMFSDEFSQRTPLLYGGSCNPTNAKEIFSCPDVDGGLIGGASLKSDDFISITQSF